MANISHINTDVASRFFSPLEEVNHQSQSQYTCRTISDLDYAILGILRCVSHAKTGHEFLQPHLDQGQRGPKVDHFFKALKSGRRLANLISLNAEIGEVMKQKVSDPFAPFSELDQFDFYSADGHYQKAACHDSKPDREGKAKIATGHFFRQNLRTDHLDHLDLSRPKDALAST